MDEIFRLIDAYEELFYLGIFIWTFFEGETIVIFGGYAAYADIIEEVPLFLAAWFGSFLGDQLWYFLGWRFGPALLERFPRLRSKTDLALELLRRHHVIFIMSFRFVYGIRNVSSFAVGLARLPWPRFCVLNFIAAGIWAASFVGAGYAFGHVSEEVLGAGTRTFAIVTLLVFLTVVTILLRRLSARVIASQTPRQ